MKRFALTFIRHGETNLNKERVIQGQGVDEPLSETGFKQAAAAGVFLENVQFTHVFCSDLLRTKQKYGVAEGKPLSELRAMAKAKGEECPFFTPPGGETLDQVKMRGIDFFEFLCHQILKEADQNEQASQEGPNNYLETSLAKLFPFRKNHASNFNSDSGALDLVASVLVVSHGAYMRSLFNYFIVDLQCSRPDTVTKAELLSVSPNTGMSVFIIDIMKGEQVETVVHCVCMNFQEHLNGMN
ncbi:fructose-2,6-bisphosphatase TIGAR isoform X2 [Suncus etruscus]|uniref:fructose-2,6-bisphosphatase TIGAR isoform X2 n=1 Tax=Suncus etruscus TaxID=109475 RepID=UPI00211048AC|nr:fructose-2,6-bisphosphatase TIGAR isoform X2 [Suncus etruscus]